MDIKEKFIEIQDQILICNNKNIISKIAEIKGLYSAYELTKNEEVLNEVLEGMLEIIDTLLKVPSNNTQRAIYNKENKDGELADFYKYLVENGKKPTTADSYRKALRRVIIAKALNGVKELESRIQEMISAYEGNDKAAHNIHVASLKQYDNYLIEEKIKEQNKSCMCDNNKR